MIQPVGKPPEVSSGIQRRKETAADKSAGTRLIAKMIAGGAMEWYSLAGSCVAGQRVGI